MPETEYRLSPKAINDLQNIWDYLSPLSERAADVLIENIHKKITSALDFPMQRSPRPKLGPKARILIEGQYVIVCEPADYGLFVVTVVHGRRRPDDWPKHTKT
ncbi:MAG: plasmid stabilization system protein [Rhizobium sp.]|nr:plasmid stabilization system protein [Rhizobium sp.]